MQVASSPVNQGRTARYYIYYAMVTDMILHVFTDHMDWIGRIVDTCKNFTRIVLMLLYAVFYILYVP